ncbi:MAG: NAD-dependent epimerase/dehydratase family protein, partial [Pedobacter sp.]
VNLCVQKGIRLLHVSSIATLGEARKGELITEETYPDPSIKTHAYGMSKNAGELEVWRGIAEGLDAVIVNPSVIMGANALYEGSGAIFKLIKDGMRFYTEGASGFVAVEDVAKSMVLLMNSSITGQRFIVSSENYCYKDLFTKIAEGFGVKPPTIEARPWMLEIAWRGAKLASLISGKAPALTKDTAASSFNLSYYDNQKIRSAVNIAFAPLNKVIEQVTSKLMATDRSAPGNE